MTCPWCGEDIEVPDDDRASMGYPSQSGAVCCSWACSEAMDAPRQPEPTDDPPEDASQTPPPRAHQHDEDCHPFLRGEEDEHQECSVCGVSHGDPCPECGGRGYHDPDCSEVIERAEPIDRDEERAAHGDYLYDQMKDERLERERQP